MADVPQPSTSSCNMQQNGQKRPLEKGPSGKKYFLRKPKGKKGQPMAANIDPQPSTSNGTVQQNGQEKLAKSSKEENSDYEWKKWYQTLETPNTPRYSRSLERIFFVFYKLRKWFL